MKKIFDIIFILGLFYASYRGIIRGAIIRFKYRCKGMHLELDRIYTDIELMDMLINKKFSYPDMKNMRINENGHVVIEGKYSGHELIINENILNVDIGASFWKTQDKCIEEAEVIKCYIEKMININAPVDAYKKYKKFKNRRYKNIVALLLFIFVVLYIFNEEGMDISNVFNGSFNSSNISSSYLPDYSNELTVGEAFENFFGNPKWKSYEVGIQKYVDFQGTCSMDGEDATAVLTFAVFDDYFKVDSIKINNEPLDSYNMTILLDKVFSSESSDEKNISMQEETFVMENTSVNANETQAEASTKQDIAEHSAIELVGKKVSDIIDEYGEDYIFPDDGIDGARYIYYENEPYYFLFVPEDWDNTNINEETITSIKISEGGIIDGRSSVGMTFDELSNELGISLEPEYDSEFDMNWLSHFKLYDDYEVWIYSDSEDGKTNRASIKYLPQTSSENSGQYPIIGDWTWEYSILKITENEFDGRDYCIQSFDDNVYIVDVYETDMTTRYMIQMGEDNQSMMLYMYNESTYSYTGGSEYFRSY